MAKKPIAANYIECTARQVYERTRNLLAFSIAEQFVGRFRNQHCYGYVFADNSIFLVYSDFSKAYREPNGNMLARRKD